MQSTFLNEMKIYAMRFTLQSREGNIRDNRYDEARDSFKSNVGVSL